MVCQHGEAKKKYKFNNIYLFKCNQCKLIYKKTKKNRISPHKLYNEYYVNEISSRFHFGIEYVIRLLRLFRSFKIYTIHPQARNILDIGSGRGFMLYYLKNFFKYKRTVGTQICKNAVDFSRKKLGLEIYDKDFLKINFRKVKFDIITIWHVLEHVDEPEKYIQKMRKLLNKQSFIIIEVPNFNSWTRKYTGKYWLGLDLKYHNTFFTPESLSLLVKKYKFKIVNVHTFSLEYSTFISTQSIVSKITKTDQLFFTWLQSAGFKPEILYHLLLFLLLFPFCLIINIFLYYSKKGETLLMTIQKD